MLLQVFNGSGLCNWHSVRPRALSLIDMEILTYLQIIRHRLWFTTVANELLFGNGGFSFKEMILADPK